MKKLPTGIQNFRKIREGDYTYIDKTQYIYDLIENENHCFLSRPRRFGKSLLLNTIADVFSGDKELFKGLFIHDSGYDFEEHPVLRLDMSNIANMTPEELKSSLGAALRERIVEEGLDIDSTIPSDIYKWLIKALYKKYNKTVVVLVDEYDKPILDHIVDAELAEANRNVLRGFYGILKSMDQYIRFTFITGVTKFTKTSVFSGINNLRDITLTKKYANICGISAEELDKHFKQHISSLQSLDEFALYDSVRESILEWYDGYSWDGMTRVINPFALLSFFSEKRFANFWYASGTPAFLIKLIKSKPSSFLLLNNLEISERVLDTFDINRISIAPLLFQTGYLTIAEKRFRGVSESFLLKIPNNEVKEAFYLNIIAEFTENDDAFAESAYWQIKESLRTGNLVNILVTLKSLFASIPYELHVNREAYYHSIFLALMNLLGFDVSAEISVSGGRIDATMELEDRFYIMEFKYEGCASDATADEKRKLFDKALDDGMKQIKNRGYYKKYSASEKIVHLAAFAFLGRDDIDMRTEILEHE